MKKKKYRFDVGLEIQELSSIPLLNGVLFCKVRLLQGGDFSSSTPRKEVQDHSVQWSAHFQFSCKLLATASTGLLEACHGRVSVRKGNQGLKWMTMIDDDELMEVKGGKSFEKLGYVDINLAEFAGSGTTSRRYILEGYNDNKSHRQDNSILKVNVSMTLLSGDPLFKTPKSPHHTLALTATETEDTKASNCNDTSAGASTTASSEDSTELVRSLSDSVKVNFQSYPVSGVSTYPGHKRNASAGSQHSRTSGYSSHSGSSTIDMKRKTSGDRFSSSHSRQSICTAENGNGDADCTCNYSSVIGSAAKTSLRNDEVQKKIDDTRVSADEIIDQLIQGHDFTLNSAINEEDNQLSLFIAKDGTAAALAGNDLRRKYIHRSTGGSEEDKFKTL